MTIKAEEVFNPKDFESIKLCIVFENITTRTVVKENDKCELLELGDKKLVLSVPKKSCNKKHSVLIKISKEDKKISKEKNIELFDTTGKIIECEELEDSLRITVECLQFEEHRWNQLFNLFLSRQDEITNFFKAVRGY